MIINVPWSELKTFCVTRNLSIQYVSTGSVYYLAAQDGSIELNSQISIVDFPSIESEQKDFEDTLKIKGNKSYTVKTQPFSSKILPDGKKLNGRLHGISGVVSTSPGNIDFVVPYDNCKITGVEIIGGELGDKVNFKIFDTPTGLISGVPDLLLNQFGIDVNITSSLYKRDFAYDADLIKDLKLRIEYTTANLNLLPKNIHINFVIHEVKP